MLSDATVYVMACTCNMRTNLFKKNLTEKAFFNVAAYGWRARFASTLKDGFLDNPRLVTNSGTKALTGTMSVKLFLKRVVRILLITSLRHDVHNAACTGVPRTFHRSFFLVAPSCTGVPMAWQRCPTGVGQALHSFPQAPHSKTSSRQHWP